jgi:hypothetical protein
MIFELVIRHLIVRIIGLYSRFLFFKIFRKKNISLIDLSGKKGENSEYSQDFYNAIVGSIVFFIISILIAYLVFS